MPAPLIQFVVDGDVQMARGFSRFAEDVKDLQPAFKEIVREFHAIEAKQFESEGGYGSGGWTPLAPSTVERKARGGYPSKIMVRTEALLSSLVREGHGADIEIRPLSLRVGTDVPYAGYHQQGRGVPKRPLVQLTGGDKQSIMKILQRYLVKEARKEFGGLMPTIGVGTAHIGSI